MSEVKRYKSGRKKQPYKSIWILEKLHTALIDYSNEKGLRYQDASSVAVHEYLKKRGVNIDLQKKDDAI